MKNYIKLTFALMLTTVFSSCLKKPNLTPTDYVDCTNQRVIDSLAIIDDSIIHQYIADSSLIVDSTTTGLFYMISDTGTGNYPLLNATITVKYKAYLTNGYIIDQTLRDATATFSLDRLILGWQYGVPLIKKSGKIKLIIPSRLAYGCGTNYGIPRNSVIIFDIELINFQ